MQSWDITGATRQEHAVDFGPCRAIATLGTSALPKSLFEDVNHFSDFACIVASTFTQAAIPEKDWTASDDADDFALKCTQIYEPEFAYSDPTHAARQRLLSSAMLDEVVVNCVSATEISNRTHREHIYEQFDLRERWSIAQRVTPDRALTISLLKRGDQSRLSLADIRQLIRIAPMLLAIVRRNRELAPQDGIHRPHVHRQLLARNADLTARELEVCALLLEGLTLYAIAGELRLKKTTVETYRDRAYRKLDIHFRNQLFALAR